MAAPAVAAGLLGGGTGFEWAALLLPMLMGGVGGFLDTTSEEMLALQREQFEKTLPLQKGALGLQGANLMSSLLGEKKGLLGDIGTGQGFSAAAGFGG